MQGNGNRAGETIGDPMAAVDELVELRDSVEEWARKAAEAVLCFRQGNGSFWKDTTAIQSGDGEDSPHITTTARAYIGLLYADRLDARKFARPRPKWSEDFGNFVGKAHIACKKGGFAETRKAKGETEVGNGTATDTDRQDVNVFDVAHLADYLQVADYLNRFYPEEKEWDAGPMFEPLEVSSAHVHGNGSGPASEHIKVHLIEAIRGVDGSGEAYFEKPAEGAPEKPDARHFFATLHALRGLHALKAKVPDDDLKRIVDAARAFSIEQAFYYQRGVTHRQDPVRLAFAGCIYALYSDHVDRDVCTAIVESLARAQQQNGSWPATHPIIRGGRLPWHIASHEVALCLTWLYFQPKFPDDARGLLISMMGRYFRQAVIPTFVKTPLIKGQTYQGWQDDHTRSSDTAVGWATAIVCHFLGNFSVVLSDWINRKVVDELGLTQSCMHLMIDFEEAADRRSLQWVKPDGADALWPDLPPSAWSHDRPKADDLAGTLIGSWTDPLPGNLTCKSVAEKVLEPILTAANGRPQWDRCAGILPGAPGTRKTSLIKQIGKVLRWPMIPVPASLIFERGFDMMEAQASFVFDRLNQVRGCILFFDEFEEFFASRSGTRSSKQDEPSVFVPEQAPASAGDSVADASQSVGDQAAGGTPGRSQASGDEGRYMSRTIAAFTTSAMLPRLQDLHDKTYCLIFVATNHIDKIDNAIIRRGRFDYQLPINNPSAVRLIEYVREMPEASKKQVGLDKLTEADRSTFVEAIAAALDGIAVTDDRPLRFEHVEAAFRTEVPREGESQTDLTTRIRAKLDQRPRAGEGAPELWDL